ncbi:MAG: hypothetical protein ACAI43_16065 [Phycisphaerae bacterium]|nr:hypothetical protein [Tepidisphaeraceae bacterium]
MEQIELLRLAIEALERLRIGYMVVGSYASGSYGEPRLTHDIDIVIDLRLELVDALVAAFPEPDFYAEREAALWALRNRSQFNVLDTTSAQKIDFIVPKDDDFARSEFSRRQRREIVPGLPAYTARPEDVIIAKMRFYQEGASEKHLRDITSMLSVTGPSIDRAYIEGWAARQGLLDVWNAIVERLSSP